MKKLCSLLLVLCLGCRGAEPKLNITVERDWPERQPAEGHITARISLETNL